MTNEAELCRVHPWWWWLVRAVIVFFWVLFRMRCLPRLFFFGTFLGRAGEEWDLSLWTIGLPGPTNAWAFSVRTRWKEPMCRVFRDARHPQREKWMPEMPLPLGNRASSSHPVGNSFLFVPA
ncbi:hypothetical protein QBC39DRAFT_345499 [Podospora conica]|nr:hypothetical protein QBC39DRAFT_345499 [Schizothecium conicum]